MPRQNITNIIIGGVVVVLLIILILGIKGGWLEGVLNIQFPSGVSPTDIDKTPTSPSCTFSFDKSTACVGEEVTATIRDGALKRCVVAYDYEGEGWRIYNVENLDVNGRVTETQSADIAGEYVFTALCGYFEGENFIIECRTNDATINIIDCDEECTDSDGGDNKYSPGHVTFEDMSYYDYCLEEGDVYDLYEYYCLDGDFMGHKVHCDEGQECFATRSGGYCRDVEGYSIGDIVDETNVNDILVGGDYAEVLIDLSGVDVGGDCYLGAKIWTSWDYVDESECTGLMGNEGVDWVFYDSTTAQLLATDTYPQSHYFDLCPLVWDGKTPWRLKMFKLLNLPDCEIEYGMMVQVYVCECN